MDGHHHAQDVGHHSTHDIGHHDRHFHIDIDKHSHSDHTVKFGGCIGKSVCVEGTIKHSTQTHGELKLFKDVSVHGPLQGPTLTHTVIPSIVLADPSSYNIHNHITL